MPDQNLIILQTKLHQPPLPHILVQRSWLIEWLNFDNDRPLTLVVAPAGYGKTTLIGTWLKNLATGQNDKASSIIPSAWLALDKNDSDLNVFIGYFIAALRTIFNQACAETQALLQARQQPPQTLLYTTLCNELAGLPGEVILVLDDYQFIGGRDVHNLLNELTQHWPEPLHLVLISRIDPPIPLSRLRAKGMIRELRIEDLRFTPQETAAYLNQERFIQVDQPTLQVMEKRFEGWPAGLHLAALSLRSAGSQESVLSALTSENANITEYLVDEVLNHQFPAVHSFLLRTSILNRFSASLCEAVIGEVSAAENVRASLNWIEYSDLFIIPLDNRREWYRYHHLFQELLRQRLSVEMAHDELSIMHRRASAWFEAHGLLDEAIQHALAAGDLDLAAQQMVAGLRDAINNEDRPTLERWLRLLPEEMIQQHPGLLMIRAWVLQFTWRLSLQSQVIQQAEKLLDANEGESVSVVEAQLLRGQILLIKAEHAYFSNQQVLAIDLCQQALALLPPSWTFGRGGAFLYLGLSMQANGQALEAERLLLNEYESYGNKTDTFALFVLQSLCFVYLNSGQLDQARQLAQVLLQGSIHSGLALMKYWADWFLGMVCFLRNELDAAAQYFTEITKHSYIAQLSAYRDAVAALTLIHQVKGEYTKAWQMVDAISQFDLEQSGSEDSRTRSLRGRLLLNQGDLESARRSVELSTNPTPDMALMWLEEPQVTRVRVLIGSGADTDMQLPLQILDDLTAISECTHNTRFQIELLAMRALVLNIQGDTSKANTVLEQVLALVQPGRFVRVFVDLGKPMQVMLQQLVQQGISVELVGSILAEFQEEEKYWVSRARAHQPSANSKLAEPLTPREIEVLTLLRGPVSIKEIAQKLYISPASVKRYTINIYGKLGVNKRWNAVAKAEELNILPPNQI